MSVLNFRFNKFYIRSIVFRLNPDVRSGTRKFSLKVDFGMEYEKKDNVLTLNQKVTIKDKDEDAPFSLDLIGVGEFEFEGSIEKKDVEELVHVNCAAIMFPFLREAIADIVRKSGLSPLLLPPTNFAARYNEFKQNKNKEIGKDTSDYCKAKTKPRKRTVQKNH